MKKIEINILSFMLIEAFILLFFFHESIINIILGSIIGLIIILIIKKIKFNKIAKIFLLIISIGLFIATTFFITQYIKENILKFYPETIIIISLIILSFYLSRKGYHTFIKTIELSSYLYLFLKIISFFLCLPNISISNFNHQLFSELEININALYIGLFTSYIYLGINYLTSYQFGIKSYIINIANPIITKILSLMILGKTLLYLYDYPYISILKRIKYFDFIERTEGLFSLYYLIIFYFLETFIMLIIISLIKKKTILSSQCDNIL